MITLEQAVKNIVCEVCGKVISEKRLQQGKTTCCRSCANSLASKKQWSDVSKREKLLLGIRQKASSEESRLNRSKISKALWQSDEFRNNIKQLNSTEEYKAKRSNASKEKWKNPEFKEKTSTSIKLAYSKPEVKQTHKNAMKQANLREDTKEHRKNALKAIWANPQYRDARIASLKEAYKRPELLEKCSLSVKDAFKRPEVKANHKAGLKKAYKERKEEILQKINITKRKNHSFNASKPEQYILQQLQSIFPDTTHQYRSKQYPFNCDFYIPSLDLYIEYNGIWTHGYRPFDEHDKSCIEQLNVWKEKAKTSKFYQTAIYIWTNLDVRKRQCAMDNNLNYRYFYNLKDFNQWYNSIVFNKGDIK